MAKSKRFLSMFLAVLLLFTGVFATSLPASAYTKPTESRTIAIVFDNSASMYWRGNKEWCRAIYAMEVFAAMLNKGDTLLIYPMNPITVGNSSTEYTMTNPYKITESSQSSTIREICCSNPQGTPIESIDYAVEGMKKERADKKYLIVLTDGTSFHLENEELTADKTRVELDKRFNAHAGSDLAMMYLGIGEKVVMPSKTETQYFVKRQAKDSSAVLSTLTELCNLVFGRDTLPPNHIKSNSIDFDISMNKLIVFVQGENISDLKLKAASSDAKVGSQVGTPISTKYSDIGCGDGGRFKKEELVVDTSLQGMMVTYEDCTNGEYTIEYNGTATSIEVYYEPAADLSFVFTDASGNTVDPQGLYEGDYIVSFGMMDAMTGKLIEESDLLGMDPVPHYEGSYYINGEKTSFTEDGFMGTQEISLKEGDSFKAELTVTYLGGYTITKNSSAFGWPEKGIPVLPRPAKNLELKIGGGETLYSLQDLEEGAPYTVEVYYDGEKLTGDALQSVELACDEASSNAALELKLEEDHYKLYLHYKDPSAPQNTVCGACTVTLSASYKEQGSSPANAQTPLTYNIEDDFSPLKMSVTVPESYIVISDLETSQPITVDLTLNGAKLSPEEFAAVRLEIDCGGIAHTVTPNESDSSYTIKLLPTEGIAEDDYSIKIVGYHIDHIGRETSTDETVSITLSTLPLWVKWAIGLLLLLLLIAIILLILHIKVLPKYAHITKRDSTMIFDGEDDTKSTTFLAKVEKGQMTVHSKYAGTKIGLVMDVRPGKESYLRKPQARRSAEVKSSSVRKLGNATVLEASIGSIKYLLNEDTGKLERMPKNDKPFVLRHGTTISYSGTMLNAGVPRPFTVNTKLNFKKK